ncbi:hypothetical protein EDD11_010164, partial [Mortierella claussenii]
VKELKADSGAREAVPEQEDNLARDDYMEDTEGELGGTTSAYDDDDFISSASDNLVDETIDLLDDEEFPHALEQEEMVHHPLATSTYDHELEEPNPRQLRERFREPTPSSSSRLKNSGSIKRAGSGSSSGGGGNIGRKSEGLSRLPMPRGGAGAAQQPPRTSSPTSGSPTSASVSVTSPSSTVPSSIATPSHRLSLAGSLSRRSSANVSPPLKAGRDARASPESTSPSGASDTNGAGSLRGNSSSHLKRPSVTTMRQSSSNTTASIATNGGSHRPGGATASSSILSNGHAASATTDSPFGMNSPTSPRVTTTLAVVPAGQANGTSSLSQSQSQSSAMSMSTSSSSSSSTSASSSSPSTWSFSVSEMQEFVKEHRMELQDCGELTKRETKLLKNVMLGMSSAAMAETTGYRGDKESFERYLGELDEIVDEKLICIVAMSQKLKALRSQM